MSACEWSNQCDMGRNANSSTRLTMGLSDRPASRHASLLTLHPSPSLSLLYITCHASLRYSSKDSLNSTALENGNSKMELAEQLRDGRPTYARRSIPGRSALQPYLHRRLDYRHGSTLALIPNLTATDIMQYTLPARRFIHPSHHTPIDPLLNMAHRPR